MNGLLNRLPDLTINLTGTEEYRRTKGIIKVYQWSKGSLVKSEIINLDIACCKAYLVLISASEEFSVIPLVCSRNGYSYSVTYIESFTPLTIKEAKIIYYEGNLLLNENIKNSKIIACGVFS
ncbi:MAG: hypothetical protein K5917_04880 [Clostridiales bacterium]|nr:hypothetical protein [Clostridiales bacterium]